MGWVIEEGPSLGRELKGGSFLGRRIGERCLYRVVEERCVWELYGVGWWSVGVESRAHRRHFQQ
jgi:hypothetical protein